MNTRDASNSKSVLKIVMLSLMTIALVVSGVFAYLYASNSITNHLSIQLAGADGLKIVEPHFSASAAKNLKAGSTISKDPAIQNNSEEDAYIVAEVSVPHYTDIDGNKHELFSYTTNEGWSQAAFYEKNGCAIYRYFYEPENAVLAAGSTSPAIFDNVKVADYAKVDSVEENAEINVSCFGVPSEGFESIYDAVDAYYAENGDPDTKSYILNPDFRMINYIYNEFDDVYNIPNGTYVYFDPWHHSWPGTSNGVIKLITTDIKAPEDANFVDGVSCIVDGQDSGVVGWIDGDTLYLSTQKRGQKIIMNEASNYHKVFKGSDTYSTGYCNLNYFTYCCPVTTIDLSHVDLSNNGSMGYMFGDCMSLTELKMNMPTVPLVDWRSPEGDNWQEYPDGTSTYYGMFWRCSSLTELPSLTGLNMGSVSMASFFEECNALKTIDFTGVNFSQVSNLYYMFNQCYALESVKFGAADLTKVTGMSNMFASLSSLKTVDMSECQFSNLDTYVSYMFNNCTSLETVTLPAHSKIKVTRTAYCYSMFQYCSKLKTINNISSLDFSGVSSIQSMFYGCSSLTELDLSSWDVSSISDMYAMFRGCSSLETLNVSGWNTSKLSTISYCFYDCSNLKEIIGIESWDTSSVKFAESAFYNCSVLECDLSAWVRCSTQSPNVTNFNSNAPGVIPPIWIS